MASTRADIPPGLANKIAEAKREKRKRRLVFSTRLLVTFVLGLGVATAMSVRVHPSFTLLCMVHEPELPTDGRYQPSTVGPSPGNLTPVQLTTTADSGSSVPEGEFRWDKQFQGIVLSAFFYGYMPTMVIGGWIADRFPSHKVAIISGVLQAVFMLLMPELTRISSYAIIVLRILQGVAGCVFYPAFNVILRNWSGAGEFSLLFSIAWSGGYVGSGLSFPMSSAICRSPALGGWVGVFYLAGACLLGWCILAAVVVTESPEDNWLVSDTEREYLSSQEHVQTSEKEPVKPVSICTLLSNLQIWIICLSYFVTSWFFAALNITLPTFMKEGFDFDIRENGLVSALPSVAMGVLIIVGGQMFKYLHTEHGVSKTNTRKIMALIGSLIPAACMTAVILLPLSQRYLGVILISVAQGFSTFVISAGPVSAAADIAPQYIGFIWGLASSIGNITGFLVPIVAALMTPNGTLTEWCQFFMLTIGQLVLLSVVVGCLWRSEVQPFARRDPPITTVVLPAGDAPTSRRPSLPAPADTVDLTWRRDSLV